MLVSLWRGRPMTIARAVVEAVPKPWGRLHTQPWRHERASKERIGEVWFGRADDEKSELLLKLLFTEQPLSIQVHPDDAIANSIGLPRGKTEAWYILSATPNAEVAIGLKTPLSKRDLRSAISDGSIASLVRWQTAKEGDCFSVPAGTIHAIGAGIVLAEIQQRSDATFRLFDFGRNRELHVEPAVNASHTHPPRAQALPTKLDDDRILLVANPHFSLEKIQLQPQISRRLKVTRESWIFIVEGKATFGEIGASVGESIFAIDESVSIQTGEVGVTFLIGYSGSSRDAVILASKQRENSKKLILHQGGRA